MVVVSYSGREINAKIVYYGPGLSGKTTNLEKIYDSVPETNRGRMVSMKTQTDRTLFFDLLPLDLGDLQGMKTRLLLYTVPGQVYYNATRKLVLKGVDAVVFVADSAPDKMAENRESLANLEMNLKAYGIELRNLPWVLQLNKRDLPNAAAVEDMVRELNRHQVPIFEAQAANGAGVFETLRGISKLLLAKIAKDVLAKEQGSAAPGASKSRDSARPTAPAADAPAAPSRESAGGKLLKFLKRGKEEPAAPIEHAPLEAEPVLSDDFLAEGPEPAGLAPEPDTDSYEEEVPLTEADFVREEGLSGRPSGPPPPPARPSRPRSRPAAVEIQAAEGSTDGMHRVSVPIDLGELPASGRVTLTLEVRIHVEPRGALPKGSAAAEGSGIDESFTRDLEVIP